MKCRTVAMLPLVLLSASLLCAQQTAATLNVRDFGAKGDGQTDDAGCLSKGLGRGRTGRRWRGLRPPGQLPFRRPAQRSLGRNAQGRLGVGPGA